MVKHFDRMKNSSRISCIIEIHCELLIALASKCLQRQSMSVETCDNTCSCPIHGTTHGQNKAHANITVQLAVVCAKLELPRTSETQIFHCTWSSNNSALSLVWKRSHVWIDALTPVFSRYGLPKSGLNLSAQLHWVSSNNVRKEDT